LTCDQTWFTVGPDWSTRLVDLGQKLRSVNALSRIPRRTVGLATTMLGLIAAASFFAASGSAHTSMAAAAAAPPLVKPYTGFESTYPKAFRVPKAVSGKKYTIGCQNPVGAGNETTKTFCDGVAAEATALKMRYIGLDDGLSLDKQVSNFNQLLAQGVNAIVLYPLAPDALRASLAKAKKQGVVVVGLNVTFTKSAKAPGYAAQVWEGRDTEAYLSVAQMAKLAPHGNVAVIGIGAPVPAIKYLTQRYRYWAGKFGLKVVGEGDNASDDIPGGNKAMAGLLGKYSNIDGVLAYNDESAVGAYTAARTAGRTGIKVIGINGSSLGLSALRAGHISAVVQVDAVGQGAQAAGAAYNVLTKQGLPLPNVVVRSARLITSANIGSVSSWSKELAQIRSGKLSR
jgi:ribose transport system substrate-binding protein